jgi:hypothetical protein
MLGMHNGPISSLSGWGNWKLSTHVKSLILKLNEKMIQDRMWPNCDFQGAV